MDKSAVASLHILCLSIIFQVEKIEDPTNILFSIYNSKKNVKFLIYRIRFLVYIKSKCRGQMRTIGEIASLDAGGGLW